MSTESPYPPQGETAAGDTEAPAAAAAGDTSAAPVVDERVTSESFDMKSFAASLLEAVREQPSLVDESSRPAEPAPQLAPQVPQFGGVASPVTTAQPAISEEGGYVNAMPLLTTGAAGPVVAYLAKLLDEHGYPNHVHAGTAAAVLDDALMILVRAFQAAQGIDPSTPQDGAAPLIPKNHEGLVDAKTWLALHKGDAERVAQDGRHTMLETLQAVGF